MHRKLRRQDRALSPEETIALLDRVEYGVLSTVSSDGTPYGVPVNYCLLGGAIYFHCAMDGHKLDNIFADPRVSFCVVGQTKVQPSQFATRYESVIVGGRSEEVFAEEKQMALERLLEKYSPEFLPEGQRYIDAHRDKTRVVRISIDTISGKARK